MSRSRRRFIAVGSIAGALVLSAAVFLPAFVGSSNCGGNSAALAACKGVALCFQLVAAEHRGKPVSVAELSAPERECFDQVAGLSWLGDSTVLVTSAKIGPAGREIVAACDTAFDNVPRRIFGKAPFTHAVAYADGSTALLSSEEFRHLDLSGFVDVKSIQARNLDPDGPANRNQPIRSETNRTSSPAGSRR